MTETRPPLKPIGLVGSLFYFGIPALIFAASILGGLPWLVRHGYSPYFAFNVTFGTPLAMMFGAALVAYRLEGRPWTWAAFRERMRLGRMTGSLWLWTLVLVVAGFLLGIVSSKLGALVAGVRFYTAPAEFSTFMGNMQRGEFGFDLTGRWDILLLTVVSVAVLNIGGEELWWRGIVLPRQELALGKWAWLVNGLLWDLFHFFYHTNLGSAVAYLSATLPLAYVAQRTRNTWPGIVAHLVANYGLPVGILLKVLGRSIP